MRFILTFLILVSICHAEDDPNKANRWEVEELRKEVQQLKAQIKLLMDANPGIRDNIQAQLKKEKEESDKKLVETITIETVAQNGGSLITKLGESFQVSREYQEVVKSWRKGDTFEDFKKASVPGEFNCFWVKNARTQDSALVKSIGILPK